ncbi:PREDICTED: laminin subunit beta-1-like [Nicrophorus vespilloides]|uniref:Laminin subunit beta-1-like n=1 Tax=Nicrophorus vespilloides TaxID=110193 RepID=A0ABM1MNL5_NICVS|nr:PREDICTED: laminin subunit beta-1-like [Nicrophorus vespilloides]
MMNYTIMLFLIAILLCGDQSSYVKGECSGKFCLPIGNLLIGREDRLYASSTCGLNSPESYYIVSNLENNHSMVCDSRSKDISKNHQISNIISKVDKESGITTWWQSENSKDNVWIQLNLETQFLMTHFTMIFQSFRPAAMLVEKSSDFQRTWQVCAYYASDCDLSFPGIPKGSPSSPSEVTCVSKYSDITPSTNGEMVYQSLLPQFKNTSNLEDLLLVTNLRLKFTKLHTLGDHILDKSMKYKQKYYYAINEMVVRGSCFCNGHADSCMPFSKYDSSPHMVHGKCRCKHNTDGPNCQKCREFYNDLPWKPSTDKQNNVCQKCNCNNHANSCHFDMRVYNASGFISGGVCSRCKHNTAGNQCETCKRYFYRDETKAITDPRVCLPCNCNVSGIMKGDMICSSVTDEKRNMIAGQCYCKENVEGKRCDSCKKGFWNFNVANPKGCSPCNCDSLGSLGTECNVHTGGCICKKYVTGYKCDKCKDGYWGLNNQDTGCTPCNCDPDGAYGYTCNAVTGQCKCRSHMSGKKCLQPEERFYIPTISLFLYDADFAKRSQDCQIIIREPKKNNLKHSWNGQIFIKVFYKSRISFEIKNVLKSMLYHLTILYESSQDWEVRMKIERPYESGFCNKSEINDYVAKLDGKLNKYEIPEPICLEKGLTYQITFIVETADANVLIDAIMLLPNIANIPRLSIYQNTFSNCLRNSNSPRDCKNETVGVYYSNGALPCDCDVSGSSSRLCNRMGGACSCVANVYGRKCDKCIPGTFDLSSEGCKSCDCNSLTSLDNMCDANGQCNCRKNIYGKQCNQCLLGFWNYPNCVRCKCNGHADTCDAETGACNKCKDNTQGDNCDECREGFYGRPDLDKQIACRACPCPGVAGSNQYFATGCELLSNNVVCKCLEGYKGERCDECADNYYGNPRMPGGSCKPCECNENIDLSKPGNCDVNTGKCLGCLYNTAGFHCEICKKNFYRLEHGDCFDCNCDPYGTDVNGFCNSETGQCACLPNVQGMQCNECIENHWNIKSSEGCESCNCYSVGSTSTECDLNTGQCECRSNYGGIQCNQCKENFWGNPEEDQCKECLCDADGSTTLQCDRETGKCSCHLGKGGQFCDNCVRGYKKFGSSCILCEECFDNWDRILMAHKEKANIFIQKYKMIRANGITGVYIEEFTEIESNIEYVDNTIRTLKKIDLRPMDVRSIELNNDISNIKVKAKKLEVKLVKTSTESKLFKYDLECINSKMVKLDDELNKLSYFKIEMDSMNVPASLYAIDDGKEKADRAISRINSSDKYLEHADRQSTSIKTMLRQTEQITESQSEIVEDLLKSIKKEISILKNKFKIAKNIIYKNKDSELANNTLNKANHEIQQINIKANTFIRNLPISDTRTALNASMENYKDVKMMYNNIIDVQTAIDKIIENLMEELLTPVHILKVAEDIMKMDIPAKETRKLISNIKKNACVLTNVDPVVEETFEKLDLATNLSERTLRSESDLHGFDYQMNNIMVNIKESNRDLNTAKEGFETSKHNWYNNAFAPEKFEELLQRTQTLLEEQSYSIDNMMVSIDSINLNLVRNEQEAEMILSSSRNVKMQAVNIKHNLFDINAKFCNATSRINQIHSMVDNLSNDSKSLVSKSVVLLGKLGDFEERLKIIYNHRPASLDDVLYKFGKLLQESEEYKIMIKDKYDQCN